METIEERLREKVKVYGNLFEGECAKMLNSIHSYSDIIDALSSEEPNALIFSIETVVPAVADLLSPNQIKYLKSRLEKLSSNRQMRDIAYACRQADEEDTITVAETARDTLSAIEKYLA